MTYQLHHGNCIDIMPLIERKSVDAIVTDPPYGLGFMGKDWDHGVPGEHFWREAYRCAKPGAYLLAFGGTRTFHRLAVAIEDAGFEIRDCVMWVYGQGFPKSHDVSKAIDREAGAERERIGTHPGGIKSYQKLWKDHGGRQYAKGFSEDLHKDGVPITKPSTESAQEWDGWGTALKPAWEPILVARKPLQGTVAENVQRYGTGAMNIDGCRIGTADGHGGGAKMSSSGKTLGNFSVEYEHDGFTQSSQGRWPANLIHDGSAEVLAGFPMTTSGGMPNKVYTNSWRTGFKPGEDVDHMTYADTGSAARFFYCAKASKQDRDEGLEGLEKRKSGYRPNEPEGGYNPNGDGLSARMDKSIPALNHHPTVKPTSLMRYLCRLVTPPQGVILDPFMGSGSTGKAAMLEGFNFIGIDTEIEYVEIAARRIEHACEKVGIVVEQPMMFETKRETVDRPKQLMLL